MFYYDDKDGNFEKLIRDYITAAHGGYEIGRGWPEAWPEYGAPGPPEIGGPATGLHGLPYGFNPAAAAAETAAEPAPAGEAALRLQPAIDEVLDEYDYEGSPIFSDALSRALLTEIVEKAMQRAALLIKEVRDIMCGPGGGTYDRRGLLYCAVEGAVLREIFAVRRHHHRQVMGSGR